MQMLREGVRAGFIDPDKGTLGVQARLLAQRCQDFTPPANLGQGTAAVVRDLSRIYFPQSENTYSSKSVRKIVRNDDRIAWNAAARNFSGSHGLRNTQAIGFTEALHQQYRDKRGRAVRAKYGNIGFVTLGPEARKARDYMKVVKTRVGWAKGGWNAGATFGGGGGTMPGWVSRHGTARGRVTDGRTDPDPFISVANDTGWARSSRGEGERVVSKAIETRIRDMHAYAEKMCKVAAEAATGSAAA